MADPKRKRRTTEFYRDILETPSTARNRDGQGARTYLEALRWGSERVCPHCGTVNHSFATKKPGV